VVAALGVGLVYGAKNVDDGWKKIGEFTKERKYTVIRRDGRCFRGSIQSFDEKKLVLDAMEIPRTDVLRLSDTPFAPAHDVLFSSRSSWADVQGAEPAGPEYLEIVTKQDRTLKLKNPVVSDEAIRDGKTTISKADIRYVSYVRVKPLTASEEYALKEGAEIIVPKVWFGSRFMAKTSVLIYNVDLSEENKPIGCDL
jgi:small nuclear ribonucleoprotein (snRNP)-like protein